MCVRVERNEEKEEQKLYACTHTHTRACALLFVGERRPSGRERWAAGCESAAAAAARGVAGRPRRCPQAAQAAARRSRPSACVSKLPPRHFGSAVACTHACHLHTRKSAFTQTDRQTNKQTDTRTQTNRQTDTHTHTNNQTNKRSSVRAFRCRAAHKVVVQERWLRCRLCIANERTLQSPQRIWIYVRLVRFIQGHVARLVLCTVRHSERSRERGQEREVKRERERLRER